MGKTFVILSWSLLGACWFFFFRTLQAAGKRQALNYTACVDTESARLNLKLHITGLICMGLIPILFYFTLLRDSLDPITLFVLKPQSWWLLFPVLAAGITGYIQSQKQLKSYGAAGPGSAAEYISLRIFFIISYEVFFRGFIFFESLKLFPAIPAIAFNTVLYFLYHLHSNPKERLGTLVLGPLLCIITLNTDTVVGAILVHLALTLSYELPLLNPPTVIAKESL